MNTRPRQLAAVSELRQTGHSWRFTAGSAPPSACYVCGGTSKRGEGRWRLLLHEARLITVCTACRARV